MLCMLMYTNWWNKANMHGYQQDLTCVSFDPLKSRMDDKRLDLASPPPLEGGGLLLPPGLPFGAGGGGGGPPPIGGGGGGAPPL